jgi:hypothetical protein
LPTPVPKSQRRGSSETDSSDGNNGGGNGSEADGEGGDEWPGEGFIGIDGAAVCQKDDISDEVARNLLWWWVDGSSCEEDHEDDERLPLGVFNQLGIAASFPPAKAKPNVVQNAYRAAAKRLLALEFVSLRVPVPASFSMLSANARAAAIKKAQNNWPSGEDVVEAPYDGLRVLIDYTGEAPVKRARAGGNTRK